MTDKRSQETSSQDKSQTTPQATPQNKPAAKLWGGRFTEATDAFVERFTASIQFDQRLYREDIRGSVAHATMLAKCGVLLAEEKEQIVAGLNAIKDEIDAGQFSWSVALEDVHMNIETALTQRIGDVGKKLHTGRSRNDQVATDIRLYLRAQSEVISQEIARFQHGILDLAEQHCDCIMPGFTHLQTAQPITFGHHLMAWFEMLERDYTRLRDCVKRMNQSPLGAAALAGTTYPIDREFTAKALDFDEPTRNSLDSVSDRDFAIEFCAFASLLMTHLSRMGEEIVLWSSSQFNFIDLPDRFCTGSSIMPQKKNPDVPELVRGKTGRTYGNLMSLLTLMKSQPLAYNKDNQEDKEPLFDTVDTVTDCLRAFADMVPAMVPKTEVMYAATRAGFPTATDLADYLVRKGIPFRDAHDIVGKAVNYGVENKLDLSDIPLNALQQFSTIIEQDVFEVLTLEGSVAARDHLGGTAPSQVKQAIAQRRHSLQNR